MDGLEIMAAISHVVPYDPPGKEKMTFDQIVDARNKYFAGESKYNMVKLVVLVHDDKPDLWRQIHSKIYHITIT